MDVDAITFTGSTAVGKLFLKYSGESNMKAVSLECGGKTPNIVFADAPDLDEAASGAADGIFYNSGPGVRCGLAPARRGEDPRPLPGEGEAARRRSISPAIRSMQTTKMGSMVDETQTKRVLGYIAKGKEEGAALALGGKQVRKRPAASISSPRSSTASTTA